MDTDTAYNQALDYLYSFVDYSLKKSSELAKADFNLDRMRELMTALGNPERDFPVIHVAGTKGKGSTSALIASALSAAGYKTGLYTSPHLQDYTERIQVDGQPISHAGMVDLVDIIKPFVERIPKLTTFEITTALGFLYFSRQNATAAVIEVGLGGRLDATNVVNPRVAVITSLSYDHMAVLGNTLTLIAGEKAGIIKNGIPVVSAPQVDEAFRVLEQVSAERKAPLTLVGRELTFKTGEHSLEGQNLTIFTPEPVDLCIPLLGEHQAANAATAYAALIASRLDVSKKAIRQGFGKVVWPCRFEVALHDPPLILDSAHNPDSFEKLASTLEAYFPGRPVILIFGSSEDKDMGGMLKILKNQISLVLATKAIHPRATEPESINKLVVSMGIPVEEVTTVEAALDRAMQLAAGTDQIIVSAGSMFVTAEVKTAWQKMNIGSNA